MDQHPLPRADTGEGIISIFSLSSTHDSRTSLVRSKPLSARRRSMSPSPRGYGGGKSQLLLSFFNTELRCFSYSFETIAPHRKSLSPSTRGMWLRCHWRIRILHAKLYPTEERKSSPISARSLRSQLYKSRRRSLHVGLNRPDRSKFRRAQPVPSASRCESAF